MAGISASMAVKRVLGNAFLRVMGWRPDGAAPERGGYVLIAAPHTTNWDFSFTIALSFVYDVPIRWMGKASLFEGPQGKLFEWLGGVPVVRSERRNMVDQMIELFERKDDLVLLVPSEGTRSRVPHWKSGFYHIARGADVPVVLGFLDYARKRGGFGPPVELTGDVEKDMDGIRAFYSDKVGKFPEKFGPVRLREEVPAEERLAPDRAKTS